MTQTRIDINERGKNEPRWKAGYRWFDRFACGSAASHAAIIAFNRIVSDARDCRRLGDIIGARYAAQGARALLIGFGKRTPWRRRPA